MKNVDWVRSIGFLIFWWYFYGRIGVNEGLEIGNAEIVVSEDLILGGTGHFWDHFFKGFDFDSFEGIGVVLVNVGGEGEEESGWEEVDIVLHEMK